MKKYQFIIKKTSEKEIKINEKNHSEAMIKLLQKAIIEDKDFLLNEENQNKEIYVGIEKITDENGKENWEDYKDFCEENKFFITKENESELDENDEEIEDDLPREYIEIVCNKCGNCIKIDDEDLFSE